MVYNRRVKDGNASLRKIAPTVLAERFDAMMVNAAGTREGSDPEALHDMRVASRRLRAALDAFGPCYAGRTFRRVTRETKALTHALGVVRDDDVLLDSLGGYAKDIPQEERPALEGFIAHLTAARDEHRAALVRHLDALDANNYAHRFHRAVKKTD